MNKLTVFVAGAFFGIVATLAVFPPEKFINLLTGGNPLPTFSVGVTYRVYNVQQAFDERTGRPIFWVTAARMRTAYLKDIDTTVDIQTQGVNLYVVRQSSVEDATTLMAKQSRFDTVKAKFDGDRVRVTKE